MYVRALLCYASECAEAQTQLVRCGPAAAGGEYNRSTTLLIRYYILLLQRDSL